MQRALTKLRSRGASLQDAVTARVLCTQRSALCYAKLRMRRLLALLLPTKDCSAAVVLTADMAACMTAWSEMHVCNPGAATGEHALPTDSATAPADKCAARTATSSSPQGPAHPGGIRTKLSIRHARMQQPHRGACRRASRRAWSRSPVTRMARAGAF